MLLVAAIGGIAVLFGRLVYLEIRNTTIATNGVPAYYAAESGIEESFLRYRFGKDQEIPVEDAVINSANGYISNLTVPAAPLGSTALKQGVSTNTTNFYNNKYDQKYFLQDTSKTDKDLLASSGNTGIYDTRANIEAKYPEYIINRDDTARIDLGSYFELNGNQQFNLALRYLDGSANLCSIVEVKIIGQKSDGTMMEKKGLYYNNDSDKCSYSSTRYGLLQNGASYTQAMIGAVKYAILHPKTDMYPTLPLINTILTIKNIDSGINNDSTDDKIVFSLDMDGVHNDIQNTIKSVGYYGGSTRTLSATINRSYGGLQDMFNYVIYKASN